MLRFRREHVICHLFFALLLAGLGGGGLRADTIDYAGDAVFAGTPVDTSRLQGRSVTLAEIISAVEKQGSLRFVYDADRLPMGAEVVVAAGAADTRPLAGLLTEISTQVAVVFKRRSNLVAVWGKGPDDIIADGSAPVEAASSESGSAPKSPPTENQVTTPGPGTDPQAELSAQATRVTAELAAPVIEAPASGTTEVETAARPGEVLHLEKFRVEGKTPTNSQVVLRQKAAVAVDMLTSRDFSKFIATDVSDIIVRLPGLSTTTRGSFAVVRGLSERYNPVMMDGIALPSSDPERQSPELDIFPSRLVDAIAITKAYEPRLPGTASGAGIDLLGKPIPEGRFAQVQFGIKVDEGLLQGEPFLGSKRTGIWDYLALGVKDRRAVPPPRTPTSAATDYVRSPNTVNGLREEKYPLGTRFSVTYENRLMLDEEKGRALGYGLSLAYESTASSESGTKLAVGNIFQTAEGAVNGNLQTGQFSFNAEDYMESEVETRLGVLGTLGFAFNKRHQVALSYFRSQIGMDTHAQTTHGNLTSNITFAAYERLRRGEPPAPGDPAGDPGDRTTDAMELYYRQRSLSNIHLSGEHQLTESGGVKLNWDLARVGARQQEPEYLNFPYVDSGSGPKRYQAPLGATLDRYTRYWRDTKESSKIARLDAEIKFDLGPILDTVVRAGYYGDRTTRDYTEDAIALNGGELSGSTVAELVAALQTYTGLADRFSGSTVQPFAKGDRMLDALYVSWQLPLAGNRPGLQKLDLLVGARLEDYQLSSEGTGLVGNESSLRFYQTLRQKLQQPVVPGETNNTIYRGTIDERKSLPAVALTYSPIQPLTVRLAWSKTTARPSFREVGSYFTVDRVNDEYVHGNLQLGTSDVTNYDFRVEYFFPQSKDLVALSVFKKEITRPIERLSLDLPNIGPVSTFVNNANDAEVRGLELEAAKNLGFLGEAGSWFTVGGNFTLLDASVARDANLEAVQIASAGIADERNLYDQPEWIANAYLSFDHRASGFATTLSWFGISDVLQKVNEYSWDSYVAAQSRFDLTMSQRLGSRWQLRFSAKNLADPDRKIVADPNNTNEEIVFRRFKDGRNYSLTATYDF